VNWKKLFAIVRREYIERVRTKAFWIATLIIPIFFLGYVGIQISSSRKTGGVRDLVVVDQTGTMYQPLVKELADVEVAQKKSSSGRKGPHWVLMQRPLQGSLEATEEALRHEVLAKKLSGYLIFEPEKLRQEKEEASYYSTTVSDFIAQGELQDAINHVWLRQKMTDRGLPSELAGELEKRVDMKAFKVTEKGTAEEKGAGIMAAIIFMILMYTTFFIYGAQVMRGVIEEKSNRIVEIVIASVRPTELMLGKMIGIGLVGLTQYLAWSLVAMNLSAPGMAMVLSGGGDLGVPRVPFSMLVYFIVYFLLGYFVYAGLYTAIAAPFNTDQEAQQLAMIPMALILSGFMMYPAVMNNPSGPAAVFFSIFPFTASLVMFLRTAVSEPPAWQVAVSMLTLVATTVGMAWFAGRVYRVGILMYGKKPTIPEILRWVRYSPGKAAQPATPEAR
jgi:ABC-2 type transport system permease protein